MIFVSERSLERCIIQGQPSGSIDLKFVNCQGELRKTAINVTIASTYLPNNLP